MHVQKSPIKSATFCNAERSGMVDMCRHFEGKFWIHFPYLFS